MPLHSTRARAVSKGGKDPALLTPRGIQPQGTVPAVFLKMYKIRNPDKHQEGAIDAGVRSVGAGKAFRKVKGKA